VYAYDAKVEFHQTFRERSGACEYPFRRKSEGNPGNFVFFNSLILLTGFRQITDN
jgi:hypothetical protein